MSEGLLAKHNQKALEWINQIDGQLGWGNQNHALDALRAVLHQLRDNLPVVEAVHLGAQLPLIIRGIYFESWRPAEVPRKERMRETFINSVRENLEHYLRQSLENEDTEQIIRTVLEVLASHIDEGEVAKLESILPSGLKGLMGEAMGTVLNQSFAV